MTCAGQLDTVVVGHRHDNVLIGVVPADKSKPVVFEFRTDHPSGEDAFCETKVDIGLDARDCVGAEGEHIAGCKVIKGCSGFSAYDGDCDAFHFYWDNRQKKLTYWRL